MIEQLGGIDISPYSVFPEAEVRPASHKSAQYGAPITRPLGCCSSRVPCHPFLRMQALTTASLAPQVLLFPGTKLEVVDHTPLGHGLVQIHLREVPVALSLIK